MKHGEESMLFNNECRIRIKDLDTSRFLKGGPGEQG